MDHCRRIIRELVPLHVDGVSISAQSERNCDTQHEASALFHAAKIRLLDINNWQRLDVKIGAAFALFNPDGAACADDRAEPGLYIRVDIPGPGNAAGEGYDWVRIEAVREFPGVTGMAAGIRVRPAAAPGNGKGEVAHFYDPQSTSTFVVCRQGCLVRAMIYDQNTKMNGRGTSLLNKIRNLLIGSAAITIFSKVEWKLLTEGFLAAG